jgi:hypothetical protein
MYIYSAIFSLTTQGRFPVTQSFKNVLPITNKTTSGAVSIILIKNLQLLSRFQKPQSSGFWQVPNSLFINSLVPHKGEPQKYILKFLENNSVWKSL